MKIFLDCTFLRNKLTGVDVTFLSLINEISKNDQYNHYLIYVDSRFHIGKLKENLNNNSNFRIKRVYSPLPLQVIYSSVVFPLILKFFKFDVYHNPYFFGPLIRFSNKKTKVIITVHDLYHRTIPHLMNKSLNIIFRFFADNAIKKADNIIAISTETKNNLMNVLNISEDNIILIYQSFNSVFSKIDKNNSIINKHDFNNKRLILNVGKLLPSKGFVEIIEVFAKLKKEDFLPNDIVLINVGIIADEQYFNMINNMINGNDLNKNIYILGYITDEELKSLYSNCSSVIISSFNEGFGLPALETFYFNKPLVYRKIPSVSEVVDNAGFGFEDKLELYKILLNIIFNNNFDNDDIIAKGQKRLKLFTWEKSALLTLNLYFK